MDKEKKKRIEIYTAFRQLRNFREIQLFLEDILTPQELASITERFQIFKLIAKGVAQREISRILNVSISKVSRGAHAWKVSKGGIRHMLKKMGYLDAARRDDLFF